MENFNLIDSLPDKRKLNYESTNYTSEKHVKQGLKSVAILKFLLKNKLKIFILYYIVQILKSTMGENVSLEF